ncbi:DUF6498-containing protein [Luteolibacter algae]|uniref:DUF6498-containing protein n=1 Tax=Luteolibacter algae TaxID=454151 RepID=A0ABW5D489_9BACT
MEKNDSVSDSFSTIFLVLVNLLPIVGVLFWGWNIFEIVSLYWFENVVLGGINILKMLVASPIDAEDKAFKTVPDNMPEYLRNPAAVSKVHHGIKLFLIPFFTFHYGMFCFVHGLFVFSLLGEKNNGFGSGGLFNGTSRMVEEIFDTGGKWFVLGIVLSHLIAYFHNFIGKGEYRKTSAPELMIAPYGRIVVLHIAILFGAFVITALGGPVYLLILLILGKTALDTKLPQKAHFTLTKSESKA